MNFCTKTLCAILVLTLFGYSQANAEDVYTNQYDAIQNTTIGVLSGVVGVFTETGMEGIKSYAVNPEALETTVGEGIGTALVGVPVLEATASLAAIKASNQVAQAAIQVKKSAKQIEKTVGLMQIQANK